MKLVLVLACCCVFTETVLSQEWQRIEGSETFTLCIGTNPLNNNTIWVGGRAKIFRSYDGGKTIADTLDVSSTGISVITQILINAADTSYIIIAGDGCFASRDNGQTWTAALPDVSVGFNGESFAYEPGKPDTVYVGMIYNNEHNNHLVMRSTDGGQTWVGFSDPLIVAPAFCTLSAGGNGVLLGGFNSDGTIVRSTNGGESWSVAYSHPDAGYEIPKIVFDKTRPGTAWAILWRKQGGNGIVLKSTTNGASWTPIEIEGDPWGIDTDLQGAVYTGMLATGGRGAYVSYDAGATWLNYDIGFPKANPSGNVWNLKTSNDGLTLYIADYRQGAFWLDISQPLTAVEQQHTPPQFYLSQNYPNPFNPTTTIRFSLPDRRFTSLKVYNLLGQEMAELLNTELTVGTHEVPFQASGLPSGTYIYRLRAGNIVQSGRMVLSK